MTEHAKYHHVSDVPGLVLGSARFVDTGFDRHYHLDFHVGLVTEGIQRHRSKGESYLLGPGRIALMPPGEIHDGVPEGGDAYTLKTFRLSQVLVASLTEEISGQPRELELTGVLLEDAGLAGNLRGLHDAMQQAVGPGSLAVQTQWITLLEHLLSQSRATRPETITGTLSPLQWSRVRDYCFSHIDQRITLDDLAGLCGLGRFPFLKQFKRTIGMTPHAWLLRLRLERACGLLSRSGQPIIEVAHAVGFYDQSHFNRAFRQAFGVAPSRYRT
ncbi:AraC family transcriptional regulator [Pseudomonas sp. PDM26]|uniref:AraC family transcriptional regulator n=1 Tax=unclassified Pseudomonas TaxID=196821 RepID=UPI000D370259|nr:MULTISPECIES: AraC family transcriptional regulator [unclassified Pseudomonas]MBV7545683.1 AraC family transcriptional regulator [Pseudomonas sp. PDM26]PTR27985.1 AraC family transcriptional regulator [Pseudomonas sp. GV085]